MRKLKMKHNPKNERVKHKYFVFLKEAKRLNDSSIDSVAQALSKYEIYTQYKDFKYFHIDQAIGFKKQIAKQISKATGKRLVWSLPPLSLASRLIRWSKKWQNSP